KFSRAWRCASLACFNHRAKTSPTSTLRPSCAESMPARTTASDLVAYSPRTSVEPCPWLPRLTDDFPSANRKGCLIRPSERNASNDDIGGLQVHLAVPLVVTRVDELDRCVNNLEHGHITRRTQLQRTQLGNPIDDLSRIDGRHGDHLFQREAHVEELAHHPRQIRHAGRIARENMDIGGNRIGPGACGYRHLGDRVVEASAAVA